MKKVEISRGAIRIDEAPTQIISGTIHYFRIHPDQWRDRIVKARAMGLNCIETYLSWNLHEPEPGRFDFTGMLDFEAFLAMVQEEGLHAIVRPGPFICAECDNGGFPAWLMTLPGIRFRCMNRPYLDAVERYFGEVLPRLRKQLYSHGGPVIMVQIENEYGSYCRDKNYLEYLREMFAERYHIDVPLFTSDGYGNFSLQGGTLDGVFQTLNFGSRARDAFEAGRRYRPDDPDFCMEFWNGWFDHWGEEHHTRPADDVAAELDTMLGMGASVNFYVFCGGTNFGFLNGANGPDPKYEPTITSYDYDAPLSECGDITEKYKACQQVIAKYRRDFTPELPPDSRKIAYGKVQLTQSVPLYECLNLLGKTHHSLLPEPMEFYGQDFGFINYRCRLNGPFRGDLNFHDVRDRAQIFLDGRPLGTIYRNEPQPQITVETPRGGAQLDILVENMGRVNIGPKLGLDQKGIAGGVCIWGQLQTDFEVTTLDFRHIPELPFGSFWNTPEIPMLYRAGFEVAEIADTFLEFPGTKGVVFINGFNLGRYWNIGPGNTLYVPAPLLRQGANEVIVLELHSLKNDCINFVATPQLN